MEDEVLELNEEQPSLDEKQPEADSGKPAAAPEDETQKQLKEMRKELAEARALAAENQKLAQHWAEKASAGTKPPPPEKPAAKSVDEFVTDFTTKGADAIREQGFVRESDIPAIVAKQIAEENAKRDELARNAQAVMDELGISDDAALRKETFKHLEGIAAQYPDMNQTAALRWAAERAQASMGGKEQSVDRNAAKRQVSGGDRGVSRGVMSGSVSNALSSNDSTVLAHFKNHGLREENFLRAKSRGKADL